MTKILKAPTCHQYKPELLITTVLFMLRKSVDFSDAINLTELLELKHKKDYDKILKYIEELEFELNGSIPQITIKYSNYSVMK